tara:strand:- start:9462 stop:9851 length:390 start_codon:yes stop_codon:yes gene_type:complete
MSIQGKKIATFNQACQIASMILDASIEAFKLPIGIGFMIVERAKNEAILMSSRLSSTPHEHFNNKGQIDKRKVRKHKRKSGFKPHTARILRRRNNGVSDELTIECITDIRGKLDKTDMSKDYVVSTDDN